jgi:hypothetical protein
MIKKGLVVMTLVWITLGVIGAGFWSYQRNIGPPGTAGRLGPAEMEAEAITETQPPEPQRQWGIEVESLSLSAAEYMLVFRYRVTDPDKAMPVFDRKVKPYLLDKETGGKYRVPRPPKVGPLRQTTLKPEFGRVYYMMFANPGKFLKKGKIVDVVIGDYIASNLVIN